MERTIKFHIHNVQELGKKFHESGPFIQLVGELFEAPFELKPLENHTFPEKFPNCCPFHESALIHAKKWFNNFPNCCPNHQQLLKKHWFKKENYRSVIEKVPQALSFTEHAISILKDHPQWYHEITDYIQYCIAGFGEPAIGDHLYINGLKILLEAEAGTLASLAIFKKNALLEYLKKRDIPTLDQDTDFNQLHRIFQKWLKAIPSIDFFRSFKSRMLGKAPLNLMLQNTRYNKYLGQQFGKTRTKTEFVELLVQLTKGLLSSFDSRELIQDGNVSTLDKYNIDLINEKHNLKQLQLLQEFTSGEAKYLIIISRWLENENDYFNEVQPLLKPRNFPKTCPFELDELDDFIVEISMNRIRPVFMAFISRLSAIEPQTEVIMLSNRLERLERENRQGIIERDYYNIEYNRIVKSAIDKINHLRDNLKQLPNSKKQPNK